MRGISIGILVAACLQAGLAAVPAAEPAPFLRPLETGYLLNYSFLSPRPYCWPGKECMLSGWEVDRSGGTFAFSPNCHYPTGFAFHSDWFKLVDSSSNAAVTLRHPIARQTKGVIVLEFRFRMPVLMDGVSWQLQDLARAGVNLFTENGRLCCQAGGRRPVTLQPLEPNHDYGVKVVADLAHQWATVYVDGRRRGESLPFCSPIKSIDYVLVKTGEAATGDLFLNPVNVYKGYSVCETFVTGAAGTAPADWRVRSGQVAVETFECGTKPDIFSLRLEAAGQKLAAAVKPFEPSRHKTEFEFRLLLPATSSDATIEIGGGSRNGLRVFTAGDDLCLGDRQSRLTTLVPHYRRDFWYWVKLVADPVAGQAEVFINGKRSGDPVAFASPAGRFDQLRLATRQVMWVDDILAYPWRDYPTDYVPAPRPSPARAPYLLGVQSCNLWQEGHAYAGWDYVYPYRAQRRPLLGWYDEGNPEETDWEIKWQVEHGISFEQHCWYRPNNAVNHPIKDGVLDQAIVKGLFNSRYGHLARFTIMCTDEGACETNLEDFRRNIVPYWIEYFFKDPRYLKIDGRPVLSIYHLRNWLKMFGGESGGRQAVAMLREDCRQAGFPGVIVWMENRATDRRTLETMKAMGIEGCYAYTWGTPDVKVQRARLEAQRSAAAAVGIDQLPSIAMGWDREAWGVHDGGWTPLEDYRGLAQWARDEFMPSLPAESLGRRVLMLANWNEFGEGHFLMPATLAGFGYLDGLREVFSAGGPHEDLAPTEAQRARLSVLYPRD